MTLLADYTFSPTLRYEKHQLIYTPDQDEPMVLQGILGFATIGDFPIE